MPTDISGFSESQSWPPLHFYDLPQELQSKMRGATSVAETTFSSEATEFTPSF
jgi:hypothetical protein